jgi:hypothetical protein
MSVKKFEPERVLELEKKDAIIACAREKFKSDLLRANSIEVIAQYGR